MGRYPVVVYARVSTDEQAEKGYSLESQLEEGKRKALSLGYAEEQILFLTDDESGAKLNRPGLDRLRELVAGPDKPEVVILFDPDRLARKLSYQLMLTDEITGAGVKLHFVQFDYKKTAEGQMYYQLRGMFAEYEREKIRERTIRGRLTKLKLHGKLSYDPRLYGYTFDTERDVLVVNEAEAKVVRLIFEGAAAGMSGERIAAKLAEGSVPAPRGDKWYGSTVTRILNNRSYLGTYMAYKSDYHQGYKRNRPAEEQVPIPIEPLVSRELFEAAQSTLARHRTRTGRPAKRTYLLTGLGRCYCGRSVHAGIVAKSRPYAYYSCSGKRKGHYKAGSAQAEGICRSRYWNVQRVDEAVWDEISRYLQRALTRVREPLQKATAASLEREVLVQRREQLVLQQQKLLDLYLHNKVDDVLYDKKQQELESELGKLDQRMGELEQQLDQEDAHQAEGWNEAELEWMLFALPFETRKHIVDLLVSRVVFEKDRTLTIELNVAEVLGKPLVGQSHGRL